MLEHLVVGIWEASIWFLIGSQTIVMTHVWINFDMLVVHVCSLGGLWPFLMIMDILHMYCHFNITMITMYSILTMSWNEVAIYQTGDFSAHLSLIAVKFMPFNC